MFVHLSSFPKFPSKISHLQDLTTLLCDYESFKSIQSICHLPNVSLGELCERSQSSHEQLLHAIKLSNQVVSNVLNCRRISQELQNVLIGNATNIQTQMKWWGCPSELDCSSILMMKWLLAFFSYSQFCWWFYFFQFRFQENVPGIAFVQEISQHMSSLNSMLNITENLTDSSKQGSFLYLFYNVGKRHTPCCKS